MSISNTVYKNAGKLLGEKNLRSSRGCLRNTIGSGEKAGFILTAAALAVIGIVVVFKSAQDLGRPIDRIGG